MELTLNAMGTSFAFLLIFSFQSSQQFSHLQGVSPKGSGEKLQDEESQEKISGPSRPHGAVPRLYLGWDFCPLRPKLQRTEKYTRIRLDRMQLDKMSKAHHFSPARAPGISG